MIASMTGFARRVEKTQWGEITWNIRSLNHKSLDVSMQVPEPFRALESQCRRAIVESFSRGRIDASLSVTRTGADCETPLLDEAALQSLLAYANSVRQWAPDAAPLTITEILRWPGVVNTDAAPEQELAQSVIATLGQTLADLTNDRQREGALVKAILVEKLEQFKTGSKESKTTYPCRAAQFARPGWLKSWANWILKWTRVDGNRKSAWCWSSLMWSKKPTGLICMSQNLSEC